MSIILSGISIQANYDVNLSYRAVSSEIYTQTYPPLNAYGENRCSTGPA